MLRFWVGVLPITRGNYLNPTPYQLSPESDYPLFTGDLNWVVLIQRPAITRVVFLAKSDSSNQKYFTCSGV